MKRSEKELERAVIEAYGLNVSTLRFAKRISSWKPKDFYFFPRLFFLNFQGGTIASFIAVMRNVVVVLRFI